MVARANSLAWGRLPLKGNLSPDWILFLSSMQISTKIAEYVKKLHLRKIPKRETTDVPVCVNQREHHEPN